MSKSELKRQNVQGKTHFADDDTLRYIKGLEENTIYLESLIILLEDRLKRANSRVDASIDKRDWFKV